MSPVAAPVAEAVAIAKRFGATRALDDVSLKIAHGESHGLVGRNGAGKSTLVGVLTGLVEPDEGEVRFAGEPAPAPAEREKWRQRVACVYQRPTVVPALTVAENLFLGAHVSRRGGIVDWRATRERAAALLKEWEIDVDPDMEASRLGVEQRQLVEIARALALGTRLMILDEPTAQLEAREIERLFERIRQLQRGGVTFLFISHHLDEIYEICQSVTVLRDGRHVVTAPVSELPKGKIVAAMVGEERVGVERRLRAGRERRHAPPVLSVEGLSCDGSFHEVDLELRPGECVGLAGLVGSGKTALADALVGLVKPDGGQVRVGGQSVPHGRPDEAIRRGIGYVPEDRHARGLVPFLSVGENVTLTICDRLGRFGLVEPNARARAARELISSLQIVTPSPDEEVANLSGGNQQKSVLARALARAPKVLVLISPTAGVDVASKEALFTTIERARDEGAAVLLVSDELDEFRICDRLLVMYEGRVVDELDAGWEDGTLVARMEGLEIDG
jgi:simple sugar transport system ATP-binding protein